MKTPFFILISSLIIFSACQAPNKIDEDQLIEIQKIHNQISLLRKTRDCYSRSNELTISWLKDDHSTYNSPNKIALVRIHESDLPNIIIELDSSFTSQNSGAYKEITSILKRELTFQTSIRDTLNLPDNYYIPDSMVEWRYDHLVNMTKTNYPLNKKHVKLITLIDFCIEEKESEFDQLLVNLSKK